MNVDTGEIKNYDDLTQEELDSGSWTELSKNELKDISERGRKGYTPIGKDELGRIKYTFKPVSRSKYTPHIGKKELTKSES